jgi:hypothetical protein
MTISKAQWHSDGDNLRLSMPFSKVDKERRIVSGFATLDNVDRQNDIVTTDASLKAFTKFRGNIREMHQPISVGKMVSFKEEKYFDPETKKFYSGVYVSAYVSKGAQDTWEKVIDGTLSGFSIGGRMNKWDDAYDEKIDKSIRVIKDYDLVELSLVDNPANQFANIMSIEKSASGETIVKGDIADLDVENVFWDSENGVVVVSKDDSAVSPVSGETMQNIGFVETNDSEKAEMIKFLVDSAKGINLAKMDREEDPMTDETKSDVVEETTVVDAAEVAPEADAVAEDVTKADEAEVAKTDDMDEDDMDDDSKEEEMDKSADMDEEEKGNSYKEEKSDSSEATVEVAKEVSKVNDVVTELKDGIASAFSDLSTVVKSLNDEIVELKKSLGVVSAELTSMKKEVTTTKGEVNEFGKRVDAVEHDTAFRKSGDLGEIVQEDQIEKSDQSLWGGRFLKTADLFR